MNTELVAETTLAETVATEIFKLNYRRTNEKSAKQIAAEIIKFSEEISPLLQEKGLKITKGSTATTTRSWQIIYLEPADGSASHNPNHNAYKKVVCDYKFLVYNNNKYGARPIALKTMRWLFQDLLMEVKKFGE